ncbi:tyrosine-type recombinase/integrase [Dolichospermum sp. ST_sed1]|nr:tyrosine-type recombinase/integrase [Dolichospermum sp. ST_sed1]
MKVQPLTSAEIETVKQIFSKKTITSERNLLLFLVGINYCLRVSDLVPLTFADIQAGRIRQQKTKNWTTIPKFVELEKKIKEYMKKYSIGSEEPLFQVYTPAGMTAEKKQLGECQVWKIFDKIGKVLGKNLGSHTMRKTGGRMLYEMTGDIRLAQQALGHSDPVSTACYIGLTDDEYAEKRFKLGTIGM